MSFSIYGTNAAGLENKIDSFKSNIEKLRPSVVMIQETKVYQKGIVKIDNFNSFELVREKNKSGGGLAIFTHNSIEAVLVSEGNEEAEFITVEANVGGMKVRLINGYGPQEKDSVHKKEAFYKKLDEEINAAKMINAGILIEMDANA